MSNISIFTLPGFWVAYESVDLGLSGFGDTEAFARPAEALTGPRTVTSVSPWNLPPVVRFPSIATVTVFRPEGRPAKSTRNDAVDQQASISWMPSPFRSEFT